MLGGMQEVAVAVCVHQHIPVCAADHTFHTPDRQDRGQGGGGGARGRYIQVNSIQSQCDKLIFQPGHLERGATPGGKRKCVCAWVKKGDVSEMRGQDTHTPP